MRVMKYVFIHPKVGLWSDAILKIKELEMRKEVLVFSWSLSKKE